MPMTHAQADELTGLLPDQYFFQAGAAQDTTTLTTGLIWQGNVGRFLGDGYLSLYWEVSLGRWSVDQPDGSTASSWVTQLGVTPVLRWSFGSGGRPWFVEGGIGANFLLPIYRSADRQFSTTFNFGDHLGFGYRFGQNQDQELVLRVQHYSNGGIKRPNPGQDFLQLRYVVRF
ncbi:acyloxyacyl hydrolase [Roseateles sp.]|uniref:acyloxyacyl hydrolase n=1 Tax=Roseateles sp. TaxID=1971397 RepID=UPI0039E7DA17